MNTLQLATASRHASCGGTANDGSVISITTGSCPSALMASLAARRNSPYPPRITEDTNTRHRGRSVIEFIDRP